MRDCAGEDVLSGFGLTRYLFNKPRYLFNALQGATNQEDIQALRREVLSLFRGKRGEA